MYILIYIITLKWFVLLPVSQLLPKYPSAQLQVYPLTWSVQFPPCWHGPMAHSSMSAVVFRTLEIKYLIYITSPYFKRIKCMFSIVISKLKWRFIITIFTARPIISINAAASIPVYFVRATSTVLTRACGAFINFYLQIFELRLINMWYITYHFYVEIHKYSFWYRYKFKWCCIITVFTVGSIISINATTGVTIYYVSASSAVLARAWGTFVNI